METLGIIQYNSGIPFCGLRYVGDLQWIQRRMVNFRHTNNRYNQTVMKEFEISEVLKAYNERECKQFNWLITQLSERLWDLFLPRWNRNAQWALHTDLWSNRRLVENPGLHPIHPSCCRIYAWSLEHSQMGLDSVRIHSSDIFLRGKHGQERRLQPTYGAHMEWKTNPDYKLIVPKFKLTEIYL